MFLGYKVGRLSVAGLCVAVIAASTIAQETDRRQRRSEREQRREAGRLDEKTTGTNIRASQLIGMDIYNSQDEEIAEVNDIVLDASTGRVRYLAVTYGGFLGVGDKMFAVPFEAFKVGQDPGDRDEHRLVLDVTQRQLEGAQGFDDDHWPDFADRNFTSEVDRRYGVKARRDRDRDIDVNIGRDGVDIDVDSQDENRK